MAAGISLPAILAYPDVMDKLILWRMDDPRYRYKMKESVMQRQWNIEARADFEDADKNEVITEAIRRAAVHVNATIALLLQADGHGQKPEVVCYSDDFFAGHQDIALLEDTLGKALVDHDSTEQDSVSAELIAAAKEMASDEA